METESALLSPIEALPNEILDSVLAAFPTTSLLSFSTVSRRFHALIACQLYRRLRRAVAMQQYQLLLECYHPSARSLTPVLSCQYLGTDGLDDCACCSPTSSQLSSPALTPSLAACVGSSVGSSVGKNPFERSEPPEFGKAYRESIHGNSSTFVDDNMHALLGMYSRFHPEPQEDHWSRFRRARRRSFFSPMPTAPSTPLSTHSAQSSSPPSLVDDTEMPSSEEDEQQQQQDEEDALLDTHHAFHDVDLDEGELFSQICTVTHLMRAGPRQGMYLSCCTITNSVIRVWRDWLARWQKEKMPSASADAVADADADAGTGADAGADGNAHTVATLDGLEAFGKNTAVLWADDDRQVGLRFRVKEREPHEDEMGDDVPVKYTLEYEELLVRTCRLLLAVEQAEGQTIVAY